jgi:hypothetical protein
MGKKKEEELRLQFACTGIAAAGDLRDGGPARRHQKRAAHGRNWL